MHQTFARLRDEVMRVFFYRAARRRVFKWFAFVLSCLLWSFKRGDVRFLRIFAGLGADRRRVSMALDQVSIYTPSFLSPKRGYFTPQPYDPPLERLGVGLCLLYSANVLKVLGRFDEAELALRALIENNVGPVKTQALIALADVLLLQAAWTLEFEPYEAAGIALDTNDLAFKTPPKAGWRRQDTQTACDLLAEVVDSHPTDRNGLWLYAYALLVAGQNLNALTQFQLYSNRQDPLFELRSLMTSAAFAHEPELGRQMAVTNAGRWIGMIDIGARKVASARSISSVDVNSCCEVYDSNSVSGQVTHFYARDDIKHHFQIEFDAVDMFSASSVEILPHYGMIATSDCLISDTSHVKTVHWVNYTTSIAGIKDKDALLSRYRRAEINEDQLIYFGNSKNFYHWMLEDLPRAIVLAQNGAEGWFLVDQDIKGWQQDSLIAAGCSPDRWRCADFSAPVHCRELTTTTLLSRDLSVHPVAVRLIREQYLSLQSSGSKSGHRLLYMSRGKNVVRKTGLLNEPELQKIFVGFGFEVVDPGSMTFDEQRRVFSEARVVAGPGGAAFTNLVFAPPDTVSVVLAPAGYYCQSFASLGACIGQTMLVCLGDTFPRSDYTWINTTYDFVIEPATVRRAIKHALRDCS